MKSQILKFKDLPFEFQRSIVIDNCENSDIKWTDIEECRVGEMVDWLDTEKVQIWIDDFSKVNGEQEFRFGVISIEEVKDGVMKWLCNEWDSFEEYHEWYRESDNTDHKDSVFPIVLGCEEYIEDGWHRFHSYVKKGLKEIPFVEYL